VDEREKDIRFSSRTRLNTDAGLHIRKIKAAIRKLISTLPDDHAHDPEIALLKHAAHENAVTVVQLIYRKRPYEGGSKDYEFSRQTMTEHWASGLADVGRVLHEHREILHGRPAAGTRVIDAGSVEQHPYKSLFSLT
jgi:NTE family protein